MKLYFHHLASPTVRKVRAVAFEAELTLDELQIDYGSQEHESDAYLALNRNAKFPTLVDNDFVLWESNAICQYVASRAPASELLPLTDERARADVSRWQCWELSHLSPSAARLFHFWTTGGAPDSSALAAAESDFRRYATVLDRHLQGRYFLVGERRTVADFCTAAILMYAAEAKLPLADFPGLARWFERVQALPGWQRSQPPPG